MCSRSVRFTCGLITRGRVIAARVIFFTSSQTLVRTYFRESWNFNICWFAFCNFSIESECRLYGAVALRPQYKLMCPARNWLHILILTERSRRTGANECEHSFWIHFFLEQPKISKSVSDSHIAYTTRVKSESNYSNVFRLCHSIDHQSHRVSSNVIVLPFIISFFFFLCAIVAVVFQLIRTYFCRDYFE